MNTATSLDAGSQASSPFGLDTASLFDLPRPAADCRIVVAMSGGVDSSVVAALAADRAEATMCVTREVSYFSKSPP